MRNRWRLSALLTGLVLYFPLLAGAACEPASPKRIFFQPWSGHEAQAKSLRTIIQIKLPARGFTHLVLQWSRTGDTHFWPEDGKGWLRGTLPSKGEIQVIHGLYNDPKFFDALKQDNLWLEVMLANIRRMSRNEAIKLFKQSPSPVAGWYLPEEIDDLNWNTPERQNILQAHFRAMSASLQALKPGIPVYGTAFFGGSGDPVAFAKMLATVHEQSGVVWLIQDGLGVDREKPTDTALFLHTIAKTLPESAWQPVLETFTEKTILGERWFCPASSRDIRIRTAIWCLTTGRNPEVMFSLNQLVFDVLKTEKNRCDNSGSGFDLIPFSFW